MVEAILAMKLASRLALTTVLVNLVLLAEGTRNPFSPGPYFPYSRPARFIVFLAASLVFSHALQMMLPRAVA